MPSGVLLSLIAYALYSCCDAIIKGFGTGLSPFEIAFWTSLFSFVPALFTKPKGERWRDTFKMRHPYLVHMRSIAGVVGNLCIIYAFTHIALAEAYSIAFLAPVVVVALSVIFLSEEVTWQRWFFLAATFAGVLLVVRPGFRDLELGHLAAIVSAIMGGIATTTLRKVAPVEKRVTLLGIPIGYVVVCNAVLMTVIPGSFNWPTLEQFALFMTIGALGGTGNILFINATRLAPISKIAPVQYSQIAWAIVFGAVFYQEFPDAIAYIGLIVVAICGIMNVLSDEARIRIFSRLSVFGPASAVSEISPPIGEKDRRYAAKQARKAAKKAARGGAPVVGK